MLGPFHFNLQSNVFPALNKAYILTLPTDIFETLDVRTFFFNESVFAFLSPLHGARGKERR